MHLSRRHFSKIVAAGAAAGLLESACRAAEADAVTPEDFGAVGDGRTNDSAAFARLAAHVNAAGGGTVVFRRTTYMVGEQKRAIGSAGAMSFEPQPLLEFRDCTKPLIIRGNGARIKCVPGLRYGLFNRVTGRRADYTLPYTTQGELSTPYNFMIRVERCSDAVEIADLELDGSLQALQVGGKYGDGGHQIPAVGLGLYDNSGSESVRNLYAHHHALDGIVIDGVDRPSPAGTTRSLVNVRCEYNGRQGCSITGGQGYVFQGCKFNHTGKAGIATAPGAGLDIEAEGKKNRNHRFVDCEFSNNYGVGMVADTGDSEGATFEHCTFVGTTAWSAWPNKPRFRFQSCNFVGAVVRCHNDDDPQRATRFYQCTFRDDPALTPTGEVYLANGPIADLYIGKNVLFDRCRFLLTHAGTLPWSVEAIYKDCEMVQRSPQPSHPQGTYLGTTRIQGNAQIVNYTLKGELIINGVPTPRR